MAPFLKVMAGSRKSITIGEEVVEQTESHRSSSLPHDPFGEIIFRLIPIARQGIGEPHL
jgi:hypothetical protein